VAEKSPEKPVSDVAVAGAIYGDSEPLADVAESERKPAGQRSKKRAPGVAEKAPRKVAEKSKKTPLPTRKKVAEKSPKSGGGSGWKLWAPPEWEPVGKVAWEPRSDRPGFQAWWAPEGKGAHRRTKTYLGYLPTVELELLDAGAVRALVEEWKAKKGIQ
jgi:hypothetical protein